MNNNSEKSGDTAVLVCLGVALREAANAATEVPLPADMLTLLLLLQHVDTEQDKHSHNLPHWTSDREAKKS
jgi:hypothetical protein